MPNLKQNQKYFKRGFTVVEILVIAPVVILVIGAFIMAIVYMTGDVMASRTSNKIVLDIQDALKTIEQDVKLSGGFLAVNNVPITNSQGYGDSSTVKFENSDTAQGTALILNSYATTTNPLVSARNLYYKKIANACPGTSPLMINVVYYTKSNQLWRRVIMPEGYATSGCNGADAAAPWQQATCTSVSGDHCKALDTLLVSNLATSGFSVSYYTNPSATNANSLTIDTGATDTKRQEALFTTNTVSITINVSTTTAGRTITQTGTIRAVSANNNWAL